MNTRKIFAAAFAVLAMGAAASTIPTLAVAQTSAQKALIDAAKADGVVGEQADGFLGFRVPSSDAALQAAVRDTNAGRRRVYEQSAATAGDGATAAVAGTRMFETQLLPRISSGQWYRNAQGAWVQR